MNKKLLELFKEHVNFPDDYTEICWKESYGQISYNTDNDVEALLEGNRETYSGEIKGEGVIIGDYILYDLDSGCGWDYQAFFSLSNKISEDEE